MGMRAVLVFAGVVISCFAAGTEAAASPSDLARVRRQFSEFYLGGEAFPRGNLALKDTNEPPPNLREALADARSLRPDGTWADIDYSSQANSGWPPERHWTRMLAIAAAGRIRQTGIPPATLDEAVHRAFAYWMKHDFQCPNWWYNQIGIPKLAGTTAILLGDALKSDEKQYLATVMMPRAKIGMTGQNRIWLAGNTLMLGLLTADEPLVAEAARTIWAETDVTDGEEGLQPDFSFHQHGPQQQFGNYGLSMAVEIGRWGAVLRGSPWAIPFAKLAVYRQFLLDGEAWVVWRGWMDVSACDRQLMPNAQTAKAKTLEQVMENAVPFDSTAASAYEAFLHRNTAPAATNDLVGTHVFWRSDYIVQRQPDWAATLKLSSRRVIGAEMVNTENLLGYHLADGALYLYRRGDEYADIFPVWDWQKVPGVTCAQVPADPPPYEHVRGDRDFVGGVTAGRTGGAVLDFARDGVEAHKAWFFDENAVICLGSDIRSARPEPVATSINQCLRHGPVTVKQAGRAARRFSGGEVVLVGTEWIEHDGWRYAFPNGATVHLRVGIQPGNWSRVFRNPETPRQDVKREVFALWLDHTRSPAEYAYVITRVGSRPDTSIIAANTSATQSVRMASGIVAAAFWTPGEQAISPALRIGADHPCLVMVDVRARKMFVAEPTQTLPRLTVSVNGKPVEVHLPSGGDAGRTVEVSL